MEIRTPKVGEGEREKEGRNGKDEIGWFYNRWRGWGGGVYSVRLHWAEER